MRWIMSTFVAASLLAPALAHAQDKPMGWVIMTPEPGRPQEVPQPWITPTYKSPRGLRQHVKTPRHRREIETPRVSTPPSPMYVPQTGQVLPNQPTLSPSGPRGTETFQDKASRCVNQAGIYGARAGDPGAYVGACVNQ
jgi:hypothetical protein